MAQKMRRKGKKHGSFWVKHGKCAQRVALWHMLERLRIERERKIKARTPTYDSVLDCFARELRRLTEGVMA